MKIAFELQTPELHIQVDGDDKVELLEEPVVEGRDVEEVEVVLGGGVDGEVGLVREVLLAPRVARLQDYLFVP